MSNVTGVAQIDPAGLLRADDVQFASIWRGMTPAQRDGLPDDVRAQGYDRFRRLTSYIDAGIKRIERAQKHNGSDADHLTTDTANAKRIAAHFADELAYTSAGWHTWDGKRYALDDDAATAVCARVGRIVMQEAAALSERAATEPDSGRRKLQGEQAAALLKFSASSENIGRILAAKTLAQSMLKRATEDFDADPLLMNCKNGVVDLRTGELLPHDRDLRLTKLAGCEFNPEAKCLAWLDFLADVFSYNAELVDFAQRLIGYFLTGLTREDVLPIFYGTGANGKTTLLTIVMAVMGDYARPAPHGLFEARADSRDDQRIAVLWSRRLVVGQETDRGARLPESFIKNATSSDRQSGRHLYGEPFDFRPTHKLVLATNHRPRVSGTDFGIWRRLLLVPFEATFRADAGNLDPRMPEKLTAELEGVLAWAVQGAIEWQRDGLRPPASVRAATEAYRQEEDVVAQYVDDRCAIDPRSEELSGDVYRDYTAWCEAGGTRPLSQRGFVDQLAHLGVKPEKGGKGRRFLTGIRLKGGAGGAVRAVSITSRVNRVV